MEIYFYILPRHPPSSPPFSSRAFPDKPYNNLVIFTTAKLGTLIPPPHPPCSILFCCFLKENLSCLVHGLAPVDQEYRRHHQDIKLLREVRALLGVDLAELRCRGKKMAIFFVSYFCSIFFFFGGGGGKGETNDVFILGGSLHVSLPTAPFPPNCESWM